MKITAQQAKESLLKRFADSIFPEPNTGCWLWGGSIAGRGYGTLTTKKKHIYAHRLSYTMYKGAIPEGLTIDHMCNNTYCVNPDHLQVLSLRENVLKNKSGPSENARKTHCKYGHPFSGENLLIEKGRFRVCRICRTNHNRRKRIRKPYRP